MNNMPNTRQMNDDALNKKLEELATKKDIENLKNLVNSLHEHIDRQNKEIGSLQERIESQEIKILQLEDRVGVLSAGLSQALKQADDNEQYSRRSCLRIKGIAKEKNETSSKCVEKVIKVCKNLKADISKDDIDRAHRVGKDRSTMIVKFFSFSKRTLLYKLRKKDTKNGIHLDITKKRLNLLDEAKKLIKKDSTVDFVFADINCNTVAKMKNGSFMFFNDLKSFQKIIESV